MRSNVDAFSAVRPVVARLGRASRLAVIAAILAGAAAHAAADAGSGLTPSQRVNIQSQISQAIAAVDPALTGASRRNAIEQSLSGLAQSDAQLGPDGIAEFARDAIHDGIAPTIVVDAGIHGTARGGLPAGVAVATIVSASIHAGAPADEIAAQAIVSGMNIPLPASEIGSALGMAAAQLEPSDPQGARAIGRVVANDGTAAMGVAYASAVVSNGGSQELASLGTGNPEVTGAYNLQLGAGQYQGGNVGNNNNGEGNLGENLPPCASPSCT